MTGTALAVSTEDSIHSTCGGWGPSLLGRVRGPNLIEFVPSPGRIDARESIPPYTLMKPL